MKPSKGEIKIVQLWRPSYCIRATQNPMCVAHLAEKYSSKVGHLLADKTPQILQSSIVFVLAYTIISLEGGISALHSLNKWTFNWLLNVKPYAQSQESQTRISWGISLLRFWNSKAVDSRTRQSVSVISEESALRPGWQTKMLRLTPCIQIPCNFRRGRTSPAVSLELWATLCLGTAHLLWSMPSWVKMSID